MSTTADEVTRITLWQNNLGIFDQFINASAVAANITTASTSIPPLAKMVAQIQAKATASAVQGAYASGAATNFPQGVTAFSLTAGGTGGTNGVDISATFSGGSLTSNPTIIFDIVAGVVTNVRMTSPGQYIGAGTPTAPAVTFPGAAGSPAITLTIGNLIPVGAYYWVYAASGKSMALYGNNAGAIATAPFGGTQSVLYLQSGIDAIVPGALDRVLKSDRNIFDIARVNDGMQMSAFAGVGTGGVLSANAGEFVTPIMEVTPGATYVVPFNVTRGIFFDASGVQLSATTNTGIDTYNFTVTVPTGQSIYGMQLEGNKSYIASGSLAKIDIHQGSRQGFKGFEFLEAVGSGLGAQKAAKATQAANTTLIYPSELQKDFVYNGAGALVSSAGSNCWATALFRIDEVRGFVSNQPIILTGQGVQFYDIDRNFLFNNGNTFTAVLNSTNSINVTATANGKPLCKGAFVDCATGGYVPGLSASALYITGVPANGAALGTYTLSGNALASATRTDMRSGGMPANVAMLPPTGFGVAYASTTYYYYMTSATPDTWALSDGPIPAFTSTSGASVSSLTLGLADIERLYPWYKIPMAAFGNSVTAGYFYDHFEQVTKCDLQIRAGVAATQLHEFLDGPRYVSLAQTQNRNAVTGDLNGPITAVAMAPIKGYTVGPLGGNEFGFISGSTYGNDPSGVTHRQPYPIGSVGYTSPVAIFQVAANGTTAITVSNMESGVIIPGTSCLFHPTAPYGLPGRYISAQTGVTSATGGTASFSGTAMTAVAAPTAGAYAIGQTITGANIPANTWIASGSNPNWVLNKSVGTVATQAISATNAGGNGTYTLDASTSVTTGSAAWTTVGTYYGSLYWFFMSKMGAWAPGAVPFLKTMYPRYDGGASNGGPTDPTNPGNPINTLGNRITDYNAATINFRDKLLHAPIVDNYAGTASTTNATAQALSSDVLHPLLTRPGSSISDAGAHWYAGRVGRVVNQYSPIFA